MKITDILNSANEYKGSAFFYTPIIYNDGKSILFQKPARTLEVSKSDDFFEKLNRITEILEEDFIGYGLINYEAGYLLEEKLKQYFIESDVPILTFYFFEKEQVKIFNSNEIDYSEIKSFQKNKDYTIGNFSLNTDEKLYKNNINKIRNFIKEGDTYQVNYTVKGNFDFKGNVHKLFFNLIFNQSAEYSAYINNGKEVIISISPELFFEVEGNIITAKPMKGTIHRGHNIDTDRSQDERLKCSKKDKAENIMILDLLRNDLGKISNYNSVNVISSNNIEKYESLFQMTSKVSSELRSNNFAEIIKNIFPCGSITGAPKIKTMEIINLLEKEPRGIYTGAIGIVKKNSYKFNVPIRTIKITDNSKGSIGIGSGVVWDSVPEEEYNETLLKSIFLTNPSEYFELFETLLIDNAKILFIEEHLNRLKEASDYFLFFFNYNMIKNSIINKLNETDIQKKYKLKVSLNKWGEVETKLSEIKIQNNIVKIIISDKKINSQDKFQYFKTTNRKLYDDEILNYSTNGFFEVVYFNENDELAEGSFTNIFANIDKKWITPKLKSGLLNGIYRQKLLDENEGYIEGDIKLADLINSEKIIVVNSVRKIVNVDQLWKGNKLLKEYK